VEDYELILLNIIIKSSNIFVGCGSCISLGLQSFV